MASPAAASAASTAAPPGPAVVDRSNRTLLALFAGTLFLNAGLLFSVQPMFTKMVLPLLGGTPAVWNGSMLFFQATLLAGYLYSHLVSSRFPLRPQMLVHLALLALSAIALPIAVPGGWRPPVGGMPVPWLLSLLAVSLGIPFFMLSTGAPLLQRWFSYSGHPAARNPYFLYAASNLGSLLALLAYPVLIEPRLPLGMQSRGWSVIYVALVLLVAACAATVWRRRETPEAVAAGDSAADVEGIAEVTPWLRVRWVLLAMAPSSLLLGVTNYISTDIASVPLLWVVPLALYLLTFVLVFARRPPLRHMWMVELQTPIVLGLTVLFVMSSHRRPSAQMALHLSAFFVTAMVCHGELARLRPRVRHLTEFYLWLSVGGMLGGLFNALVAPVIFRTVIEYPIALVVACALRPRTEHGTERARSRWLDLVLPAVSFAAIVLVLRSSPPESWMKYGTWVFWMIAALVCMSYASRPLRFALGVAALLVGAAVGRVDRDTTMLTERSFFGVYRVRKYPTYHVLQHGSTTHGGQLLAANLRTEPITYYHRDGPLGDVFATLARARPSRRVAIVGLGTGTIACYGRTGEQWTFYEIDPLVQRIARDPRYFSYLRDCPPVTSVVLGDARLSLAAAPDGEYDLIILDAFSSDAIPAHLMTREALALYLRKLAPGGAIAFHISNRYLSLQPVLAELARDARVPGSVGEDFSLTSAQTTMYKSTSTWVVVARRAIDIAELTKLPDWKPLPPEADVRVWTDDFSDIFSVFRWR